MTKLTDWIKRHQVAAFYIVTFAITCGLGFSYGAVLKRGQYLLAPLAFIAACGPALAGIIISGVDRPFHRCGGACCLCDQRGLLAHPSSEKLPLLVDRLRGVWGWSFLALVLMPALVLLSVPIRSLLRRQPITARQFPDASLGLIGLVWSSFSISYSSSMPQGKMLAGVDLQCPDCKLVSAL